MSSLPLHAADASASAGPRWTNPAALSRSTRRVLLVLLVAISAAGSVAFFFRYEILSGFAVLRGNRYDQVIELAILEHWYNVFHGISRWSETGYFYPAKDTLGYNDGYFLYGVIYSAFRVCGLDPYLSGEFVSIIVSALGFFGCYFAARRLLRLDEIWAVLTAVLFTISNNMFVQAHHAQLLSAGFAPWMAMLLDAMLAALWQGRRAAIVLWGSLSAILYSAWLLTAFYMAWYFCFFAVFTAIAAVFLAGRAGVRRWWDAARRNAGPLALVLLVLAVAGLPFLSVYLPTAHETGMHSYREVRGNTLTLPDLLFVGNGNVLYGRAVAVVNHLIRPSMPEWSERLTGFPPALLWLFACGIVLLFRTRQSSGPGHTIAVRAIGIATLATWPLAYNIGGHSLWWFVYEAFPGAPAARVVARYQIFLALPVIGIAVLYLARSAHQIVGPVLVLLCVLLVAEQANTAGTIVLDRPHELARLNSVSAPPAGCRAFFTSRARPEPLLGPELDGFYSHNVDAMIIAETIHLPTINGASTFEPLGWQLTNPDAPDYLDRVRRYARANHLEGLCALDLKTMKWSPFEVGEGPARSP